MRQSQWTRLLQTMRLLFKIIVTVWGTLLCWLETKKRVPTRDSITNRWIQSGLNLGTSLLNASRALVSIPSRTCSLSSSHTGQHLPVQQPCDRPGGIIFVWRCSLSGSKYFMCVCVFLVSVFTLIDKMIEKIVEEVIPGSSDIYSLCIQLLHSCLLLY